MRDLFEAILNALKDGQAVVRASVVKSVGSTPRGAGASMAIFPDGTIFGTIGGGMVEEASIRSGLQLLKEGRSGIREFDLTAGDAASLGMVCGGAMTVFMDVIPPGRDELSLVTGLLRRYETAEKSLLVTMWDEESGVTRREVVSIEGEMWPRWPQCPMPESGEGPWVRSVEGGWLVMEPLAVVQSVYLIGAGHVAQATARLAATLGFRVWVVDDRHAFANRERFPDVHGVQVVEGFEACLPAGLGGEDSVVIMTRGHLHDGDVLAQALKTDAGYVGMIGSRKKRGAVYDWLLGSGFTPDDLNRVHCPIGLAIGAETPEEIAVSIMAELISHRSGLLKGKR